MYQLQDSTGSIWVLARKTELQLADRVTIQGKVHYQSIPINSKEFGEIYIEEQKQLERIPTRWYLPSWVIKLFMSRSLSSIATINFSFNSRRHPQHRLPCPLGTIWRSSRSRRNSRRCRQTRIVRRNWLYSSHHIRIRLLLWSQSRTSCFPSTADSGFRSARSEWRLGYGLINSWANLSGQLLFSQSRSSTASSSCCATNSIRFYRHGS